MTVLPSRRWRYSSEDNPRGYSTTTRLTVSDENGTWDFVRFIEIAYGSVMEVVSQLQIAFRLSFVVAEVRDELYESAEELARMLSGLKASLLRE